MGFDTSNMPNIQRAAASAIELATARLSVALSTAFNRQTVTDTFLVRTPSVQNFAYTMTLFRLSQGFINSAVPFIGTATSKSVTEFSSLISTVAVDVSTSLSPSRTPNDSTGFEKGILVDTKTQYDNSLVTITYQCGFLPGPNDPLTASPAYDLTVVPDWLQASAHLQARIMLQSNPSIEDPKIQLDTRMLNQELLYILNGHARFAAAAKLPV